MLPKWQLGCTSFRVMVFVQMFWLLRISWKPTRKDFFCQENTFLENSNGTWLLVCLAIGLVTGLYLAPPSRNNSSKLGRVCCAGLRRVSRGFHLLEIFHQLGSHQTSFLHCFLICTCKLKIFRRKSLSSNQLYYITRLCSSLGSVSRS